MQSLAKLNKVVDEWLDLEKELSYISEVISMESEEEEASLGNEIQVEVDRIASRLDEFEFQLAFSGKYDNHNVIMAIHAGAGGYPVRRNKVNYYFVSYHSKVVAVNLIKQANIRYINIAFDL